MVHLHSNMRMKRLVSVLCLCAASTWALAPANPYGWEDKQPDNSPTGRLFLKGRPDTHVYVVDQHQHPVVRDDDGWYVYATTKANSTSVRGGTSRKLFHPTEYRVSPNSVPPRHLGDWQPSQPSVVSDLLCEGLEPQPWCPNNVKRSIGRFMHPPKTTGTLQLIVVLVRFSDHADRPMPSREDIDFLFNGQGTDDDRAPTGTMKDFFRYQSINQFQVQAHVQDWVTVDVTEEEASLGNYGLSSEFATVAYDTLDQMDRDGVDWSRYDEDGDGILDTVMILHSGYVAEGGGTDCNNNKEHGVHRIWSHATAVSENQDSWYSSDRSVTIGRYATTSAVFGTCGDDIQRFGVLGHELLHTLGLPDLLGGAGSAVGIFDVMGMMWGADGSLYYPGSVGLWSRQKLGWVEPTRITSSGTYTLGTSQLYKDGYRIDVGFSEGEYLLIENRQKMFLDEIMPGDGGLLIWHIDDNMWSNWQSAPGWPQQEGWPGNGNHYQIALLSSDRNYDLEQGVNMGDGGDFWKQGDRLGPGPAQATVDPDQESMYPNTNSYSEGAIQRTGVRIYDISEVGEFMTFSVDIPGSATPPIPPPTTEPSQSPTTSPIPPPTPQPSQLPTSSPSSTPTQSPTTSPTEWRTLSPTISPSQRPTPLPTASPTDSPTSSPTLPTTSPTVWPTPAPTDDLVATASPTLFSPRTPEPSLLPSSNPSKDPKGNYEVDLDEHERHKRDIILRPFDY